MNRDRFAGVWKQFSGKVKEEWCRLTDDASGVIAARREQRAGWIQEGRGISKDELKRQHPARKRDWDLSNR